MKDLVVCVSNSLTKVDDLERYGIVAVANVKDALDLAGVSNEVAMIDLRNSDSQVLGFRHLRTAYPRAFLLGIVDNETPLQSKWEATKAGCDDFIVLPVGAGVDVLSVHLRRALSEESDDRFRILAVDDEEYNRDLIEQELEDAGFEVLLAADGPRALELAATQMPDLILLDIMMPKMDGHEVCRRLKKNQRTRAIPVVMLSALDQIRDKLQALDMGANDYITKPYDSRDLVAKIRRLLWLRDVQSDLDAVIRRR